MVPTNNASGSRGARLIALIAVLLTISGTGGALALAPSTAHAQTPVAVATPDTFYDAPATVPAEPGVLLRAEPFTRDVPADARAWRILYTTTRDDGIPALASALVVAPANPDERALPVIAWTHGTTGVATTCAPSLLDAPFAAAGLHALDQILAEGWAVVTTDYVGQGTPGPHPFLIGQGTARSTLDAVRAARQIDDLALAEQTVVWGHSQGGHAALWTGALAPGYAPDVNVLGVVALAPATDLVTQLAQLQASPFGTIITAFVVDAYSRIYPDVAFDDIVRPAARGIAAQIARLCISGAMDPDAQAVGALLEQLDGGILTPDAARGPLGARLTENTPREPIPAPLLIAQGLDDDLVLPEITAAFVAERCAAGQEIAYRTYAGRGHGSLVTADSPVYADLIAWTRDRFAGSTPPSGCETGAA
jgi:pimeloyl-ACP methyl ester carboxylesterase